MLLVKTAYPLTPQNLNQSKTGQSLTVKDIRSFLRLCSYYRKFVPKFANIARPLHKLTESKAEFFWNSDCQQAFDKLKRALTSSPILSYPNNEGLFILDTDASNRGLGAVVSQVQNGT